MVRNQRLRISVLSLAAIAALSLLCSSESRANNDGEVTFSTRPDPNAVKATEASSTATTNTKTNPNSSKAVTNAEGTKQKEEEGPSVLRKYLHRTSFDSAADAAREVEKARTPKLGANECERLAAGSELTQAARVKYIQDCHEAYKRAKYSTEQMKTEAGKIRKQQELFSDISRVSDVVGVGAVGATVVGQLAMKDNSQAKSLEKVAKIQKTAGKAAYVSGATDLTLGATAYLHQKAKLEKLKNGLEQEIASEGHIISAKTTGSSISKLQTSIKKTKEAAYSHLLMGAGKVATGFVSMKLAESNKRQAEKLKSLEAVKPDIAAEAAAKVGGGPALTYTNNNPGFFMPNSSGSSSSPNLGSGSGGLGAGGGTSVLPSGAMNPLARGIAAANSPGGISGGGSGGTSGATGKSSTPNGKTAEDKTAETLGNAFELNLTGGASRFNGSGAGSGGEDPAAGMAALFSGILGQGDSAESGAGPSPYTGEADAFVQGAPEGVSESESSLFEIVKTKHNKMMQAGRVLGPGEVVTR